MENEVINIFQRLNAPFPYSEYQYDSFGDRCYFSGQAITERLNEVFEVGAVGDMKGSMTLRKSFKNQIVKIRV
jgi:hypothetical protein